MKRFERLSTLSREISSKKIGIYAANASFFILLSIFPALMLVLSLLQYTPLTPEDFLDAAAGLLPAVMEPLLAYLVTDLFADSGVTLISISAIAAVWSASRGVYSLLCGLNSIYGLRENRSYLYQRLLCMLYTLLLFAALILTLGLHIFGRRISQYLAARTIPIFRLLLYLIRLRWLVVFLLLTALFTMIFTVFPNRRMKIRAALPGAAASALGWIVFTSIFSFYVNHFANYSRIYGSLSTIAISMLWLYFCMSILFYGALLNHYLDLWRSNRRSAAKAAT